MHLASPACMHKCWLEAFICKVNPAKGCVPDWTHLAPSCFTGVHLQVTVAEVVLMPSESWKSIDRPFVV